MYDKPRNAQLLLHELLSQKPQPQPYIFVSAVYRLLAVIKASYTENPDLSRYRAYTYISLVLHIIIAMWEKTVGCSRAQTYADDF